MNKEQIKNFKNNNELFYNLINNKKDNLIIYTLKNLGKLQDENILDSLLYLASNNNSKIRVLSIKNLAKFQNISLLNVFVKYGKQDVSSDVRRECISAIGRLRKFAGSGTLGRSALKLKRNFFLTEIQKEYFERMKQIFNKDNIGLFTDNNKVKFMESDEFVTKSKKLWIK